MPRKKLDTIDYEEFERRLAANNERMRLELEQKEEELRKLQIFAARKDAFLVRLDQTIADIEREENELAVMEKELPSLRRPGRKRQTVSVAPK